MEFPAHYWGWLGFGTDYRKPIAANVNLVRTGSKDSSSSSASVNLDWTATETMTYGVSLSYRHSSSGVQFLDNFENPGGGIGGVSYVFAEMEQQTVDATLRADILFSRDLSLQLYAQPYLSIGTYADPRELLAPGSYELGAADDIPDFAPEDVHDYDFQYAEVNVNAVLRWEYRPGSTLYLVWKQGRFDYRNRAGSPELDPSLDHSALFDNEPENVFLAKVTYLFSL